MTIELTNEDKLNIIEQHIKSIDYGIYGVQLDLMEINAIPNQDAAQVANLNSRLSVLNSKRMVLVNERDSLTTQEEA